MKTLQLTGLETYISPFTKFTAIKRGDVVTVNDAEAARIMAGEENARGVKNPHWTVVADDTPVNFHFSNEIPSDQIAATQPVPRNFAPAAPAPTKVPEPVEKTADEQAVADKVAAAQAEPETATEETPAKTQRVARKAPAKK